MSNTKWISRMVRKWTLLGLVSGAVCSTIEKLPTVRYSYSKSIRGWEDPPLLTDSSIDVHGYIFGSSQDSVDDINVAYNAIEPESQIASYTEILLSGPAKSDHDEEKFRIVVGCSKNMKTLEQHESPFDDYNSIPLGFNNECFIYTRDGGSISIERIAKGMPNVLLLQVQETGGSEFGVEIAMNINHVYDRDYGRTKRFSGFSEFTPMPFEVSPKFYGASGGRNFLDSANIVVVEINETSVSISVEYDQRVWLSSTLRCDPVVLAEPQYVYKFQLDKLDCYLVSEISADVNKSLVDDFSWVIHSERSGNLVFAFNPTGTHDGFVTAVIEIRVDEIKLNKFHDEIDKSVNADLRGVDGNPLVQTVIPFSEVSMHGFDFSKNCHFQMFPELTIQSDITGPNQEIVDRLVMHFVDPVKHEEVTEGLIVLSLLAEGEESKYYDKFVIRVACGPEDKLANAEPHGVIPFGTGCVVLTDNKSIGKRINLVPNAAGKDEPVLAFSVSDLKNQHLFDWKIKIVDNSDLELSENDVSDDGAAPKVSTTSAKNMESSANVSAKAGATTIPSSIALVVLSAFALGTGV